MKPLLLVILLLSSLLLSAQASPKRVAIRAGHLINPNSETPINNAVILIEGDKIVSVTPNGTSPAGVEVIDLSNAMISPGCRNSS